MGKAPRRALKVYQAQFGFHDTVVAASSQAAALRAWGIRQNLFSTGLAQVATDPQAVEAARAHPGVPLKRAAGSGDPFVLEAAGLPTIPQAAGEGARKGAGTQSRPEAPAMPAPVRSLADRSLLDAAEVELRNLDERHARHEAELRGRQDALDAERAAAHAGYVADRKAATAAVVAARRAYRTAGGEE